MRFPRRSSRGILHQSLPSIQTLFRSSLSNGNTIRSPLLASPGQIVDGIEVVPLERQNSSTTKICTPGTEEKEVVVGWKENLELELAAKPLPSLPGSRWARMSTKCQIIAILCLQFFILLTIGLGFMATKRKGLDRQDPSFAQVADPRASPTSLPIQRGTFILPVGTPQQQSSACLSQNNESAAWTCAARKSLLLSFLPSPADQGNLATMSIESTSVIKPSTYGIQNPEINTIELTPRVDTEYPNKGAAFYFRTTYSRTVLLKEKQIVAQGQYLDTPDTNVSTIQSGDRPWLCVFNGTSLEGYIYVSENSTCANDRVHPEVGNSTVPFHIPCLPYVMKLTELLLPNRTEPYCSRMLMGVDGTLSSDGASETLKLSDDGLAPRTLANGTHTETVKGKRQQTPAPNSCRCQWMVQ